MFLIAATLLTLISSDATELAAQPATAPRVEDIPAAPASAPPALSTRSAPLLNHIMVIFGENTDNVVAGSQPYLSALAGAYPNFTDYRGVTHPSQPNYFSITCGATRVSSDVGCTSQAATNLADRVEAAALDWRGYNESMVTCCSDTTLYKSKHDFFGMYTDIKTVPARLAKVKGFTSTVQSTYSELLGATPPAVVFVSPNMNNDGHDTSVATYSAWLGGTNGDTFFQDILASKYYTDGAIFVTFDEDDSVGVNRVYCVAVSAQGKSSYVDATTYTHYSLLRTIEDNFGLATITANDAAASNMLGAFNPAGPAEVTTWTLY